MRMDKNRAPRPSGLAEQKQIEKALRESEARYRTFIDASSDMIFLKDASFRYLVVNRANQNFFGRDEPAILGKTDFDLMEEAAAKRCRETDEQALRERQVIISLEKVADRIYETRKFPVPLGATDGVGGFIRDITERKQDEEALRTTLERVHRLTESVIDVIAMAVETRDPYTAGHMKRVADLAQAIATEMGLNSEQVEGIRVAALIHDLGKISVPSEILSMPRKLSPAENKLVQTHSQTGYDILKKVAFEWSVAQIVYQHHERLDGSGYPQGLRGAEILLEARILAVADVVEAIVSNRPYRAALGIEAALAEISSQRGITYDPAVVDACLRLFQEKGYRLLNRA